jgi:hypothetical protein
MAGQPARMLGVAACAAVLAAGVTSLAEAANEDDCWKFHQECSEARAQGYRYAGICNVERLECTADPRDEPEAGVGKRPRGVDARPDARNDGERSIGP